jgi:L-iditol 2-dehydrogenase
MTAGSVSNEAALIHGVRDVRVGVETAATPGPEESQLAVRAVGLCGSDLHWYEEASVGNATLNRPDVPRRMR